MNDETVLWWGAIAIIVPIVIFWLGYLVGERHERRIWVKQMAVIKDDLWGRNGR